MKTKRLLPRSLQADGTPVDWTCTTPASTRITECIDRICENAKCERNTAFSGKCVCDPGWIGQTCDQCCDLQCENGGFCDIIDTSIRYCNCQPTFNTQSVDIRGEHYVVTIPDALHAQYMRSSQRKTVSVSSFLIRKKQSNTDSVFYYVFDWENTPYINSVIYCCYTGPYCEIPVLRPTEASLTTPGVDLNEAGMDWRIAAIVSCVLVLVLVLLVVVLVYRIHKTRHRWLMRYIFNQQTPQECEERLYDILISFDHEEAIDKVFVSQHLYPFLWKEGYSICDDSFTTDNISDTTDTSQFSNSNSVILVISPSYAKNKWTKVQSYVEIKELFRYIPVICSPLDQSRETVPQKLKHILEVKESIDWSSHKNNETAFWRHFKTVLSATKTKEVTNVSIDNGNSKHNSHDSSYCADI